MSNTAFFAPERLIMDQFIIRSYQLDDAPKLNAAANSSYKHLKAFMPWAKPHQTEEEALAIVRRFRGRYLLSEEFVLGIFSPDNQICLGGTGYHLRNGELSNRSAEIGMWIRASHAGQGLGTEVLIALLSWGFEVWPWERLTWRCDGRNIASCRTAEKAGMQLEGVLRGDHRNADGVRIDTYCYGALKSDWELPAKN
ncbi:MAG: GNAT family N-acetyltransferase [Anaerolineae bacterium]|nr:GNAT family N-acetyltransferase [Anaerolineae bacterium]